jgi:hypothetical protein
MGWRDRVKAAEVNSASTDNALSVFKPKQKILHETKQRKKEGRPTEKNRAPVKPHVDFIVIGLRNSQEGPHVLTARKGPERSS